MLRLFIGIVRAFIIGDFGRRTVLPGFTELVLAFKNGSLGIELLLSGVGRDMVRVKSWPNLFCGVLYPAEDCTLETVPFACAIIDMDPAEE